jgi:hypothetical protein
LPASVGRFAWRGEILLLYVSQFIEEAKSGGLVRKALDDIGLKTSQVAPAGLKP